MFEDKELRPESTVIPVWKHADLSQVIHKNHKDNMVNVKLLTPEANHVKGWWTDSQVLKRTWANCILQLKLS